MHNRFTTLFLFLFCTTVYVFSSPGLVWNNQHLEKPTRYKLRNSIATNHIEELGTTAEKFSDNFRDWEEGGTTHARFYTDYHAVYPLPIENFIAVLLDAGNEDKVYPNMTYTRDLTSERGLRDPRYQEVKVSFKLLGIGEKYHYIVHRIPTWYPDGSFSVHWALVHSVDNKYDSLFGCWYVKEVMIENKQHTYVRNYIETEIIDPPSLLKTVQNLFSQNTVRTFFNSLYEAAKQR